MNLSQCLRCAPAFAGVLLCALLVGCSTPQVMRLQEAGQAPGLPSRAQLESVPFFAQKEYECGPAALAMVMSAAGVAVTPDALVHQVYLPARKGSLQVEMLAATRQRGLIAYPLKPALKDLLQEVAAGHPVLVFQNLSLPIYPVWHYAVVIGFERERQTLLLHSGRTELLEMSLATFERTWARGEHWSMVLLSPATLPATAQPKAHATAAAALERVHPQAALTAYTRALQTWPTQRAALLGRGNAAYALGQLEQAAQAYRHATEVQPDFADAWNNLAQALLDQGQLVPARQAIDQAVALGEPRLAAYQALKRKIEERSATNPCTKPKNPPKGHDFDQCNAR